MTWKQLKKKYPEIWKEVYDGMVEDTKGWMSDIQYEIKLIWGNQATKENLIDRIAHNAAFLACYAIQQEGE